MPTFEKESQFQDSEIRSRSLQSGSKFYKKIILKVKYDLVLSIFVRVIVRKSCSCSAFIEIVRFVDCVLSYAK